MQAAVRDRCGGPDVVRLEEVDKPTPREGEILVRVQAESVNRGDLDWIHPRPGFVRLFMGLRAPRNHRLGLDVAGVVESVGSGVTRFRPGDEVFGDMFAYGMGAFAEYVCGPEEAFASMPNGTSFEDAAGSCDFGMDGAYIPHVKPRQGARVPPTPAKVTVGRAGAHASPRTSRSLAANASGSPAWPYSPPRKPPWSLGKRTSSVPSRSATANAPRFAN